MKSCLIWITAALLAAATSASKDEKKVVCYFGSWSVYRPGNGKFCIEDIDPTLCTHLVYTFVGISTAGAVTVLDPWQDLPDDWGKDGFGRFNALRKKSPETKTLVAIGGWNEGSQKYSNVMADPTLRKKFVENVVKFVKRHDFDGFDIDWEYPNQRGGAPRDVENYSLLVKELRERFDEEGLLLSAAVAAAKFSASLSYDIAEVSKHLHFINIMSYDLHGAWDSVVGVNAPLRPGSWESGSSLQLNVEACVKYWLDQGAPPEKLIVGVPLYGRTFTLASPSKTDIGAPARGPGNAGPYTREAGSLGYNEICEKQLKEDWTVVYNEEQSVPYAFKGNQWVGYDDPRSLEKKVNFIKSKDLGGVMVWSIETDDFKGICGERYPLLKTVNAVLRKEEPCETSKPSSSSTEKPSSPKSSTPASSTSSGSPPASADSAARPTTYKPPICYDEGVTAHPTDCTRYYICQPISGGFLEWEQVCPPGLHFDARLKVCNFPEEAKCSV